MTEEAYQRYLDRHGYDHPVEEETRKISTELSLSREVFNEHSHRAKSLLKRLRNTNIDPDAEGFLEEFDSLDDLHHHQQKVRGNARTHKQRIKGIKKHSQKNR